MINVTAFLLFEGNCREAMSFYQQCFGGDLMLVVVKDTPMKDCFPPEAQDKLCYAELKNGSMSLSAADWLHPTKSPQRGNTVALYVTGNGREDLAPIFARLTEGTNPADDPDHMEPSDVPFGIYGQLKDRFGFQWYFFSAGQQGS